MPRKSGLLSIEVVALDKKVRDLSLLAPRAVDRGLFAGITAATIDVQARAKELIHGPVLHRRTGRLWRSIQPETFRRGGTVVGIVGTDVEYAAVHEFGAKIRPKQVGGFLVFPGAEGRATGGSLVFAREVKIPRRPYMSRALQERSRRVKELINEYVLASLKKTLRQGRISPVRVRKGIGPSGNSN